MSTTKKNESLSAEQSESKKLTVIASENTESLTGVDDVATKLNRTGWARMEKPHNPFTLTVLQSLQAFGKGDKARLYFNQDKGLNPIGDFLYLNEVREQLRKCVKLADLEKSAADEDDDKKKKKKGGKTKKGKGLSAEEIIARKTAEDVKKHLPPLLANHNKTPICREGRAEFRLMQFMLYANYVTNLLAKDPNSYLAYEGLVAMHNALSSASGVTGIAKQVLIDAREVLERLRSKARFLYEELLTVYPRLVFNNLYSDLYHESVVEPYPDQKRMVESVKEDKFLAFYNTVPGSGKTTAVVGVAAMAMTLKSTIEVVKEESNEANKKIDKAEINKGRKYKTRKRHQAKKSTKGSGSRMVIFVCTNMLVREQVGRDAYNIDIPFGVAANLTFREHFNAKTRDVGLVISDLETAMEMLDKFSDRDPILFIDEPTIAAETDHNINNKIMEVMTESPRQTILSSATMPRVEELPTLCKMFKCRHPGSEVVHITSRRIGIGCHAVHKGITVFPFQTCTDVKSLERTLENLNLNPFLFRFLSIEVVVTLRERMSRCKLKFPSFEDIFPDPSTITHQKIADHAMDLLDILLKTGDDSMILKCCTPLTGNKYRPFQLSTILTEDAHQHMQGALYAALDPLVKALELSELFLKELPSIKAMLKEHTKHREAYEKEKARIIKSVKKEEDQSKQLQALPEPTLNIPARFIPNTIEHFKAYAPPGTKHDPRALQAPPISANIPEDLDVSDQVMMLLHLGIGIYSPKSQELNPERKDGIDTRYTEKVVEMCSAGYISFLFADRSIVYGTNFPFSNVFIDPEFAEISSLNTLYQLIGRAGRVGRSYMAKVFLIDEKITNRIVSFSEENIEATNLEKACNRVIDHKGIELVERKPEVVQPTKPKEEEKKKPKKEKQVTKAPEVKEDEEDNWEALDDDAAADDGSEVDD